jgi:hypothetical protein
MSNIVAKCQQFFIVVLRKKKKGYRRNDCGEMDGGE